MFNKILVSFYFLLFFLTPLLMAPFTSELFEFNKLIFIYLVSLGVCFFWLLKMISSRKIIIKKTPFDIPILLFLASQVLATVFSIDRQTSVFGYYGRFNGGLLSIISYISLYYGFVSNFLPQQNNGYLLKLLKGSLLSSLIVIIWGLSGKLGVDFSCLLFVGQLGNNCWTDQFRPAERMFSTLGQPNWLGAYLAVNFFIALYFLVKNVFTNSKISLNYLIISFYLLLNFTAILFTRSRSSLLAVVVGIFLLICYLILKLNLLTNIKARNLIVSTLALLLISTLIFKTGVDQIDQLITFPAPDKAANSTASVETGKSEQSDITASSDIRKIVWKGAIDLGLKYPILGTGVETFAYSYYFTRPIEHNLTSEWDYLYNKAHNEYLNYFATTGFFGSLSYLLLIFSVLIYGWKNSKYQTSNIKVANYKSNAENQISETMKQPARHVTHSVAGGWDNELLTVTLLISYVTILITNFFGFSTTTINLFFYLIAAFLVVLNNQVGKKDSEKIIINKFSESQKINILLLLLVTVYLLSGLVRYYLADIKYSRGDSYSKLGDFQQAAKFLGEANSFKYEHVYEDKLSNIYANLAFAASYQKESQLAKSFIKTSVDLNEKSINASQANALYWKTRAKNYYLFYQVSLDPKDIEQAIYSLQKARTLSPTDPKIPYSLAIFYSLLVEEVKDKRKQEQYQLQSLREIDESINLKSNYRDGYFLKSQLLKKAGQIQEAKKALEYILQNLNPNDSEVKSEIGNL